MPLELALISISFGLGNWADKENHKKYHCNQRVSRQSEQQITRNM
jgi:hypothetical protein